MTSGWWFSSTTVLPSWCSATAGRTTWASPGSIGLMRSATPWCSARTGGTKYFEQKIDYTSTFVNLKVPNIPFIFKSYVLCTFFLPYLDKLFFQRNQIFPIFLFVYWFAKYSSLGTGRGSSWKSASSMWRTGFTTLSGMGVYSSENFRVGEGK